PRPTPTSTRSPRPTTHDANRTAREPRGGRGASVPRLIHIAGMPRSAGLLWRILAGSPPDPHVLSAAAPRRTAYSAAARKAPMSAAIWSGYSPLMAWEASG